MESTGPSGSVSLPRRLLRRQKPWLLPLVERLQIWSLRGAIAEQDLSSWCERLRRAVPDISEQYTTWVADTPLMETKLRGQHAFQMKLLLDAVHRLAESRPDSESFNLVDIGDSSGTHLRYLEALASQDSRLAKISLQSFSVNLDPVAVEKIRSKGLNALHCRAEELFTRHQVRADLFFALETLEHLQDPTGFLDALSRSGASEFFAATVPYLKSSRVGLHHIRQGRQEPITPERTHIFELAPEDWKLLFKHAGWKVLWEGVYRQYPRFSPATPVLKTFWRRYDFEGFYGVILKRDRSWAECYQA